MVGPSSLWHMIKHLLIFWLHGPYPQFDITNRKPKAESNTSNLLANATNLLDSVVSTHQSWINTRSIKNIETTTAILITYPCSGWNLVFFPCFKPLRISAPISSLVKWWFQKSRTCCGNWIYTCARCTVYILIVCDIQIFCWTPYWRHVKHIFRLFCDP